MNRVSVRRNTFVLFGVVLLAALFVGDVFAVAFADAASSRYQVAKKKKDKKEDTQPSVAPDTSVQTAAPAASTSSKSELDIRMESLANQIAKNFTGGGKIKIAVFNFVDLHGNTSQLGMFIAEELITRLFQCGSFEVVERRLIDKVLEEQKLSTTGLLDADTAQKIGSVLGVKAIVTGTVTDLESAVKVNARIISADTGTVTAAAGETINKDNDVSKLLAALRPAQTAAADSIKPDASAISSKTSPASAQQPVEPKLSSGTFFSEDFSTVTNGYIPAGWVGGDTFVVADSQKRPGTKALSTATPGPHAFVIQNIPFPDDWVWEVQMRLLVSCCDPVTFDLGDLSVGFHTNGDSWLQKSLFQWDDNALCNQIVVYTIEKKGDVFRVMINGKQFSMVRIPGFKKPSSFRFGFKENGQNACGIYKIEGRPL